ncbi:alkyl sulfatase C-terminal domain-containing protein [Streptomyces sp. NPDC060085]|uniref:alkyl sulfatase C-terminal domain-containing protein n=1 Tax=Streptomyces sp. NPDC060085 TaxID=3347054 RepID=UPI0036582772
MDDVGRARRTQRPARSVPGHTTHRHRPQGGPGGRTAEPGERGPLAQAGKIALDGDGGALRTLADLIDTFDPDFDIVTP